MDENDRNNLEFLLNASEDVLRDWYDTVSEDDHQYAQELLYAYMLEIEELKVEIQIESALITHDLAEAKAVLSKYTLNERAG